ncbi:MAG: hypothetical protein IKL89_00020 [Clostridia bacterium]|nr:hypothetical protein [Clostridia bacterium]
MTDRELRAAFADPPREFRPSPMMHSFPEEAGVLMDAMIDYGFGGAVINVPFENGFTTNPENIARFSRWADEMDAKGLSWWLYDENGYPSGYVGGELLKKYPELEAMGMYMRRRTAYHEPLSVHFRTEDETDRVVWAAKCPLYVTPRRDDCYPVLDRSVPVEFKRDRVDCELSPWECLYVFCVRRAYEGSQCTHNTFSFSPYINLLDPRAAEKFIEMAYAPIAEAIPDAYSRARAVFTDEPSLMVSCPRNYEAWPWALVPWVDNLFAAFLEEYGFDLRPWLPLVFEGSANAAGIRSRFWRLIGKLCARGYVEPIRRWCEAHGGIFSGHYLGEESLNGHIRAYGSFIDMFRAVGLPGLDVLNCLPERYDYNTAKVPQMVCRKRQDPGMMVEICPFGHLEEFMQAPLENMIGVMNLLYMSGVRYTNSYFSSDFSAYAPDVLQGYGGTMSREEARFFTAYVGRLGAMLGKAHNRCGLFVYLGVEDVAAHYTPSVGKLAARGADEATQAVVRRIYESGHDFYYADTEDILEAAEKGSISGGEVHTVIVPALEVMPREVWEGLARLSAGGVRVLYADRLPTLSCDLSSDPAGAPLGDGKGRTVCPLADFPACLGVQEGLTLSADGKYFAARFDRDGRELWLVANGERRAMHISLAYAGKDAAEIFDPADGSSVQTDIAAGLDLEPYRAKFILI